MAYTAGAIKTLPQTEQEDDLGIYNQAQRNGPGAIAPGKEWLWDKEYWAEARVHPGDRNVWFALNPRFSDLARYYARHAQWAEKLVGKMIGEMEAEERKSARVLERMYARMAEGMRRRSEELEGEIFWKNPFLEDEGSVKTLVSRIQQTLAIRKADSERKPGSVANSLNVLGRWFDFHIKQVGDHSVATDKHPPIHHFHWRTPFLTQNEVGPSDVIKILGQGVAGKIVEAATTAALTGAPATQTFDFEKGDNNSKLAQNGMWFAEDDAVKKPCHMMSTFGDCRDAWTDDNHRCKFFNGASPGEPPDEEKYLEKVDPAGDLDEQGKADALASYSSRGKCSAVKCRDHFTAGTCEEDANNECEWVAGNFFTQRSKPELYRDWFVQKQSSVANLLTLARPENGADRMSVANLLGGLLLPTGEREQTSSEGDHDVTVKLQPLRLCHELRRMIALKRAAETRRIERWAGKLQSGNVTKDEVTLQARAGKTLLKSAEDLVQSVCPAAHCEAKSAAERKIDDKRQYDEWVNYLRDAKPAASSEAADGEQPSPDEETMKLYDNPPENGEDAEASYLDEDTGTDLRKRFTTGLEFLIQEGVIDVRPKIPVVGKLRDILDGADALHEVEQVYNEEKKKFSGWQASEEEKMAKFKELKESVLGKDPRFVKDGIFQMRLFEEGARVEASDLQEEGVVLSTNKNKDMERLGNDAEAKKKAKEEAAAAGGEGEGAGEGADGSGGEANEELPDTNTPTNEPETNTPTNEPETNTSTNEPETNTPTNEGGAEVNEKPPATSTGTSAVEVGRTRTQVGGFTAPVDARGGVAGQGEAQAAAEEQRQQHHTTHVQGVGGRKLSLDFDLDDPGDDSEMPSVGDIDNQAQDNENVDSVLRLSPEEEKQLELLDDMLSEADGGAAHHDQAAGARSTGDADAADAKVAQLAGGESTGTTQAIQNSSPEAGQPHGGAATRAAPATATPNGLKPKLTQFLEHQERSFPDRSGSSCSTYSLGTLNRRPIEISSTRSRTAATSFVLFRDRDLDYLEKGNEKEVFLSKLREHDMHDEDKTGAFVCGGPEKIERIHRAYDEEVLEMKRLAYEHLPTRYWIDAMRKLKGVPAQGSLRKEEMTDQQYFVLIREATQLYDRVRQFGNSVRRKVGLEVTQHEINPGLYQRFLKLVERLEKLAKLLFVERYKCKDAQKMDRLAKYSDESRVSMFLDLDVVGGGGTKGDAGILSGARGRSCSFSRRRWSTRNTSFADVDVFFGVKGDVRIKLGAAASTSAATGAASNAGRRGAARIPQLHVMVNAQADGSGGTLINQSPGPWSRASSSSFAADAGGAGRASSATSGWPGASGIRDLAQFASEKMLSVLSSGTSGGRGAVASSFAEVDPDYGPFPGEPKPVVSCNFGQEPMLEAGCFGYQVPPGG